MGLLAVSPNSIRLRILKGKVLVRVAAKGAVSPNSIRLRILKARQDYVWRLTWTRVSPNSIRLRILKARM